MKLEPGDDLNDQHNRTQCNGSFVPCSIRILHFPLQINLNTGFGLFLFLVDDIDLLVGDGRQALLPNIGTFSLIDLLDING